MEYNTDIYRTMYLNGNTNQFLKFDKNFRKPTRPTKANAVKILTEIAQFTDYVTPEFKELYKTYGIENLLVNAQVITQTQLGDLIQGNIRSSELTPTGKINFEKRREELGIQPFVPVVITGLEPPEIKTESKQENILAPQIVNVNTELESAIIEEDRLKLEVIEKEKRVANAAAALNKGPIMVKPASEIINVPTSTIGLPMRIETVEEVTRELQVELNALPPPSPMNRNFQRNEDLPVPFPNEELPPHAVERVPGIFPTIPERLQTGAHAVERVPGIFPTVPERLQAPPVSLPITSIPHSTIAVGNVSPAMIQPQQATQMPMQEQAMQSSNINIPGGEDGAGGAGVPSDTPGNILGNTQRAPTHPLQTDVPFATDQPNKMHPPKYHLYPIKIFLGSETDPEYDAELENNIYSSSLSKQEIVDNSNTIIANYGGDLFIYSRKSDTLDEMHELTQLMFCLKRNLQRGTRSKQAMVPISALVGFANKLAGTDPNTPVDVNSLPTGDGTEGNISGTGSSEQVQLSANQAFDKIVDAYRNAEFDSYGKPKFNEDLIEQTRIHSGSAFKFSNSLRDPINTYIQPIKIFVPKKKASVKLNY